MIFFFISKAKTQTWHGTVAGVLSVSNKTLFKSGVTEFGEAGWWALMETKPPELRPEIPGEDNSTLTLFQIERYTMTGPVNS